MKAPVLLVLCCVGVASGARAQGTVFFGNRLLPSVNPQHPGVIALIYGTEPDDPTRRLTGQAADGLPQGVQVYHGPRLSGSGYTAQLWGGPLGTPESELALCTAETGFASSPFRTGIGAGIFGVPTIAAGVPNVPPGPGSRAVLQVRVWDNQGGTVTTWDEVLALPLVARGASPLFTPPFDLGGGLVLPPQPVGLVSFNLYIIPEPSPLALALAGGAVLFCWRRKRRA